MLTNNMFAQKNALTEKEISNYVFAINQLKDKNQLVKISLLDMSACGIGVDGYYWNGNLVYINAGGGNELELVKQELFLRNDTIVRIDYKQFTAKLETYERNYPYDKYTWDLSKITYTDTSYIITFSNPTTFRKWGNEEKINKKKITPSIQQFINERLACGQEMKNELQSVMQQIDSLRFVQNMPYICEYGFDNKLADCGDKLYWNVVMLRDNAIEFLIDKLDDTTLTTAPVFYFGGNYTVADIAFTALTEIIHKIPVFELLGVPFDEEGCGYCAYWQHLNESFENRQAFKTAVHKWYHTHKYNLEWIGSNDFYTCDCRGKHPNGGHFEVEGSR